MARKDCNINMGNSMIPENVQRVLDDHGLNAILFEDGSTPTAETAARKLGVAVGQIAKSLLFQGKEGPHVLVVCAGDAKVSLSKLKKAVGFKARLATPEETRAATGYCVGGVCPFALPPSLPVFMDESLFQYGIVYPAAGNDSSGVPVAPETLLRITGAKRVDVRAEVTSV